MAKTELVTGPTVEPVTVADLLEHSRIDSHEEDGFLKTLLADALKAVEDRTWWKLITQTWDQYFDEWDDLLVLDHQPVQSLTQITYTDAAGNSQTLSSSIYELGEWNGLGVVRRQYDQNWPTARGHEDVITVRYVCGYGDAASDVPENLRAAIRLHAHHSYKYRGQESLPGVFYSLTDADTARRFV